MREPQCCWTERATPNGKCISWGPRLGLISPVLMTLCDAKNRIAVIKSQLSEWLFSKIIAVDRKEECKWAAAGWTSMGFCTKCLSLRWTLWFVESTWSHIPASLSDWCAHQTRKRLLRRDLLLSWASCWSIYTSHHRFSSAINALRSPLRIRIWAVLWFS